MFGLNSRFGSSFKISAEAFMLEGLDHRDSIACCASRNKSGVQVQRIVRLHRATGRSSCFK